MTTSVKGEDRLEEIARIVDPLAFKAWEQLNEYCLRNGDDETSAAETAEWGHGQRKAEALAKARQIAALPCKEGGKESDLAGALWCMSGVALDAEDGFTRLNPFARDLIKQAAAKLSTKPDRESADEGALREALETIRDYTADDVSMRPVHRLALSALSKDTEASAEEQQ